MAIGTRLSLLMKRCLLSLILSEILVGHAPRALAVPQQTALAVVMLTNICTIVRNEKTLQNSLQMSPLILGDVWCNHIWFWDPDNSAGSYHPAAGPDTWRRVNPTLNMSISLGCCQRKPRMPGSDIHITVGGLEAGSDEPQEKPASNFR